MEKIIFPKSLSCTCDWWWYRISKLNPPRRPKKVVNFYFVLNLPKPNATKNVLWTKKAINEQNENVFLSQFCISFEQILQAEGCHRGGETTPYTWWKLCMMRKIPFFGFLQHSVFKLIELRKNFFCHGYFVCNQSSF